MIDKLFFVVLILNATGLFRFVAPQLGVSIGQVSLVLLIFNIFYLLARLSYLIPMFSKMLPWFVVLVAWPLATLAYAPTIDLRAIGHAVYGFMLFAGTIVYAASNGLSAIHRVFLLSLILTVFGQVLNMMMPGYFETVAELANARVFSMGRPGGFFMQPNALGIGLALLFIGWLTTAKRDTFFLEPIIIVVFIGSELLTGSRTSMILGIFIVGLHLTYQWRGKIFRSQKVRYLSTRLAVLVVCIFVGMIGAKFFIESYGDRIERKGFDFVDRVSMLLEFRFTHAEKLIEDGNLQARFAAQRVYWNLIEEKPLLGHGLGTGGLYLRSGNIDMSSHSTMISVLMEYGVIYPLVFLLLLARTLFNRHRRFVEQAFGTNTVTQFVLVTLLLFVATGGLLDRRLFFVVFGMVYTAVYYPWRVFACDASTRAYTRMLSRAEVRQTQRIRKRRSRPGAVVVRKTESVDMKSGEATAI